MSCDDCTVHYQTSGSEIQRRWEIGDDLSRSRCEKCTVQHSIAECDRLEQIKASVMS